MGTNPYITKTEKLVKHNNLDSPDFIFDKQDLSSSSKVNASKLANTDPIKSNDVMLSQFSALKSGDKKAMDLSTHSPTKSTSVMNSKEGKDSKFTSVLASQSEALSSSKKDSTPSRSSKMVKKIPNQNKARD